MSSRSIGGRMKRYSKGFESDEYSRKNRPSQKSTKEDFQMVCTYLLDEFGKMKKFCGSMEELRRKRTEIEIMRRQLMEREMTLQEIREQGYKAAAEEQGFQFGFQFGTVDRPTSKEINEKNIVHVPFDDDFIINIMEHGFYNLIDKDSLFEWLQDWYTVYCQSRKWAAKHRSWFYETIFISPDLSRTKNRSVSMAGTKNIFYEYATQTPPKLNFLNIKILDESESLLKLLSIPPNTDGKCTDYSLRSCNYTNASLLTKKDLPMLKKLSADGIAFGDKLWEEGGWEDFVPFETGFAPVESNAYNPKDPDFKRTPINNTMGKRVIITILTKPHSSNGWSLMPENANIIADMIIARRTDSSIKLKPVWYQGFHLSPTNKRDIAFSQPYLHLHTVSFILLTKEARYFLFKTCPFYIVYTTIESNKCILPIMDTTESTTKSSTKTLRTTTSKSYPVLTQTPPFNVSGCDTTRLISIGDENFIVVKGLNCVYRMIAGELYRNPSKEYLLKNAVIDYIRSQAHLFSKYIWDEYQEDVTKFTNKRRKEITNPELMAMSIMQNRPLFIFRETDGDNVDLEKINENYGGKPIYVLWNGTNYDGLIKF